MSEKSTVEILRELAERNKGRTVSLPVEFVNIIEGKRQERSWKNVDADKVLNYFASMMEA